MFVKDCPILMSEFGSYKLVQDLEVGELFFDPIADEYVRVSRILSKRVDLVCGHKKGEHPLCPILFSVGSIMARSPHKEVRVSPGQAVMIAMPLGGPASTHAIRQTSALALSNSRAGVARQATRLYVEYYAIFTEADQMMDVGGLLMTSNVLNVHQSSQAARTGIPSVERLLRRPNR